MSYWSETFFSSIISFCMSYLSTKSSSGIQLHKTIKCYCSTVLSWFSHIAHFECIFLHYILNWIILGGICMSYSLKFCVNAKCLCFLFISQMSPSMRNVLLEIWEMVANMRWLGWNVHSCSKNMTWINSLLLVWNIICTTTNTDSGVIIASGMQSSGVVFPFWTSMSSFVTSRHFSTSTQKLLFRFLDNVQLKFMLKMLMMKDKAAEAHVKYLSRWLWWSKYTISKKMCNDTQVYV